uniref:Uncharacterized protein n=1 Tax=Chromera velia CCMP2878 TaxID=1169474 RepID=A0A0G4G884_9ALVE|eukprot:Cvel_20606.t1-p1 / transcript=Cvel_20606.t1 / gene=Cvel_20606 / organism=Chromera_velia_CCMP2878 / gene_product=hypothetical protein / transcript_product=hypothetical protein / location=Cvel_scaffold1864:25469-26593(+) / protein_length=375 / sequence_SO=supercontig / SO=protein_coding / is_pseudo=false
MLSSLLRRQLFCMTLALYCITCFTLWIVLSTGCWHFGPGSFKCTHFGACGPSAVCAFLKLSDVLTNLLASSATQKALYTQKAKTRSLCWTIRRLQNDLDPQNSSTWIQGFTYHETLKQLANTVIECEMMQRDSTKLVHFYDMVTSKAVDEIAGVRYLSSRDHLEASKQLDLYRGALMPVRTSLTELAGELNDFGDRMATFGGTVGNLGRRFSPHQHMIIVEEHRSAAGYAALRGLGYLTAAGLGWGAFVLCPPIGLTGGMVISGVAMGTEWAYFQTYDERHRLGEIHLQGIESDFVEAEEFFKEKSGEIKKYAESILIGADETYDLVLKAANIEGLEVLTHMADRYEDFAKQLQKLHNQAQSDAATHRRLLEGVH